MNNPKNTQNPRARHTGLVVQEMTDEVLVYDLDTNKAHCLNQSAALVWNSCNGSNSVGDIVREFEAAGKGTVTEDFVWLAIDQLNDKGLLDGEVSQRFSGQSRRQVLKTIGLASVVALPVIASLVAPQKALGGASCNCTSDANCAPLAAACGSNLCRTGSCIP